MSQLLPSPAALRRSLLALTVLAGALIHPAAAETPRQKLLLDADWRFTRNDPAGTGNQLDYSNLKAWVLPTGNDLLNVGRPAPVRPSGPAPGRDVAYTQAGFDDSSWRQLNLPHDWGIEGPFRQEYAGETGKLPWWGVAWYRKHFTAPATDSGKRIYLDLDGAMAYATVWLNGEFVGGWPYGYASWQVDLTPYYKPGTDNVLAIRLDNPPDSSRWYPGGGIYRHMWLEKTAPIHVAHWGAFVTTPVITAEQAMVDVKVTVENPTPDKATVQITTELYELDASGHKTGPAVAKAERSRPAWMAPGQPAMLAQSLSVPQPKLWSLRSPQRYVAVTTVWLGEQPTDTCETAFGIRTIAFSSTQGFLLNGVHVPIQGVCDHHDLGALGSALNERALERQLDLLRSIGCNAIRTSHNPPSPELLELCDRMGFLVMDEAFDCWHSGKTDHDYHLLFPDWHEQDLRAMVRRDRNHPCIILWSIGNEVREQGEPGGWKYAAHLAGIVHEEDRTRYTTAGFDNIQSGYNGFQTAVDVVSFNYKPQEYPKFHASAPQIPVYGSETASCISSRGEYFFPVSNDKGMGLSDYQMSSYDLYAPEWAWPPDTEFKGLDQAPYAAGEFVWTGFDYLGEPTPYNSDMTNLLNLKDPAEKAKLAAKLEELRQHPVPSRSSYFGIFDLAGFRKDRAWIYQARWRPETPMAHLLPHWNWPERVGQVTPVHVYTSGDEAELFLNGRSLGRKQRGPLEYRLRWDDVVYAPGELHVVAYRHGVKWAEDTVRTTGAAAKLTLLADRATLRADGSDLSFVTVAVADEAGQTVPRAKPLLSFTLDGPGEIIATDNGDATDHTTFSAKERKAYNGLVLVVVRTKAGQGGTITLRATGAQLAGASLALQSAP